MREDTIGSRSDSPRRLNSLRVEALSAATAGDLATTINNWVAANAGERRFVSKDHYEAGGVHYAFITYTE